MKIEQRLPLALLLLRLSVFLVMLVWTIDKFIEPQHGVIVLTKLRKESQRPPMQKLRVSQTSRK